MKVKILLLIYFFTVFAISGQERDFYTLDEAIRAGSIYLSERISGGTRIAVVNFVASQQTSNYVIGRLTSHLVNTGKFNVVDRHDLTEISREQGFNLSGNVSDESAQSIGKLLGAQTIISGSLTPFGNSHQMHIKALEVETGIVSGSITYTIMPKTTGEKIGTGALNLALGLGSYIDRDVAGGLTLTAGYLAAAGLFTIEALVMDRANPAVGVPATIGVTVMGLTMAYGFIRPFVYNRSPRIAAVIDNTQAGIVLTSDNHSEKNGLDFQMSYTIKF